MPKQSEPENQPEIPGEPPVGAPVATPVVDPEIHVSPAQVPAVSAVEEVEVVGGKPSKGTAADKRVKGNRPK